MSDGPLPPGPSDVASGGANGLSGPADGALLVTVQADPAELSAIRQKVAEAARVAGADDEVTEDFELVVSELVTNVILHTEAATLNVAFQRTQRGWVLDVSNADALLDLDDVTAPAPDVPSGRGLAIAQAVMDSVELIDVDGQQHIRCLRLAA